MAIAIFFEYIERAMGARVRFDPEHVREIMWQGMTEDEYRNAPEPFDYEQAFDEAGRSCVSLLWTSLTITFGTQKAQVAKTDNQTTASLLIYFHLNKCNPWVYKMAQGQTYDIVDTPPKDRRIWPALEAFQGREEIAKWRDSQKGIYKLHEIQDHGSNKYGPSVVLKLEHQNGPKILVWSPSSLSCALKNRKSTEYILNVGLKETEKGNKMFDFKLF